MKYLVVLLVVLVAVWVWRSNRRPAPPSARAPRGGTVPVAEMVRCGACGVHLPLADARRGARGPYCSEEHRRQIEG